MSADVRAEVAEVLAAHRFAVDGPTYPACKCGWTDGYVPGDLFGSHERHQADALAPLLARRDVEARAEGGRGVRFRVEVACDGYENLGPDDVPLDEDEDSYILGAHDAAHAIRAALAARENLSDQGGRD